MLESTKFRAATLSGLSLKVSASANAAALAGNGRAPASTEPDGGALPRAVTRGESTPLTKTGYARFCQVHKDDAFQLIAVYFDRIEWLSGINPTQSNP